MRRSQALQFGKAFDENLERRVLGLPEVLNPELIEENEARRKLTEREDHAGNLEMEQARQAAEKESSAFIIAEQGRQIEEMKKQIAQLMGDRASGNGPSPAPAVDGAPAELTGRPDPSWKLMQIVEWAESRGIPVPGRGVGLSKLAIIEDIFRREAEMAAVAPVVGVEAVMEGDDDN